MEGSQVAVREAAAPAEYQPMTAKEIREQVNLIQEVMKEVMKQGDHYGIIPGTEKPTLLKPGAEKLCLTFRLDPQYEIVKERDGIHLNIDSKCTLYHIPTGNRLGSGMGSCSTRETKYAYRHAARKCPTCEKEAIIKGKKEYGGGWVCFTKKDGCGAKFSDQDPAIIDQPVGRIPNDDVADQWNTILKMANKRSLIAAVLNATAASDIFTQDMEDAVVDVEVVDPAPAKTAAKPPVQPPQRKEQPAQQAAPAANGWRLMKAGRNSICSGTCGSEIKSGQEIAWDSSKRKALCVPCYEGPNGAFVA